MPAKTNAKTTTGRYSAKGKKEETIGDVAQRYLPLVKSIVAKMRIFIPPHVEAEDIYSIGLVGLMKALHRYNPEKENTFGAYAALRIRGAILDELRSLDWMPRRLRHKARELNLKRTELEQELGRPVDSEELAKVMEMPVRELKILEESVRPISIMHLDQVIDANSGDGSADRHSQLSDVTTLNARERVEERERIIVLRESIERLPQNIRQVLALYYHENMRLAEIAEIMELSESRICQLHARAVMMLREMVEHRESTRRK